ncbi:type IX secretion/gliding motility protein PorT/SprT [Mucilaginibacter sp.]
MKKVWLLLVLGLCCRPVLAQHVPAWGGNADLEDFSFGFLFQYVNQDFKVLKNADWRRPYYDTDTRRYLTDSLTSISSHGTPGFAVGFITRYRLTDHLEVRTTPALVFADRTLSYTYKTASQNTDKQIQTTSIDLPLSIKLKSDRLGDFRAYLLGGVKYTASLGSQARKDADAAPLDKLVKNKAGFGSYEVGVGFDIYFEYFKLSPELKLSNSFGNVLVAENHPYSAPLSKLFLRTLSFSLYFE